MTDNHSAKHQNPIPNEIFLWCLSQLLAFQSQNYSGYGVLGSPLETNFISVLGEKLPKINKRPAFNKRPGEKFSKTQ